MTNTIQSKIQPLTTIYRKEHTHLFICFYVGTHTYTHTHTYVFHPLDRALVRQLVISLRLAAQPPVLVERQTQFHGGNQSSSTHWKLTAQWCRVKLRVLCHFLIFYEYIVLPRGHYFHCNLHAHTCVLMCADVSMCVNVRCPGICSGKGCIVQWWSVSFLVPFMRIVKYMHNSTLQLRTENTEKAKLKHYYILYK